MTEESKPRSVSMNREGHTEHHRLSDGTQVDVRVDWTLDDARSGLVDEWADTRESIDLRRTIRDADGKAIAVLLSAEAYEEGQNAIWRINQDSYGQVDTKYTPFQHHPSGSVERLIDTAHLEKVITNIAHGKDAEPSKEERDRIHYGALVAAIEFSFEPDSRGLVPVMTPGRATDGQHTEYYWSFLYPTPVAGMFLRPDDHIIGSTEYTLTTGSGYAVVRGFWERDHADALAVKLAEALPGINWFTARNGDDLTADIKKTMIAIIREHGLWRAEVSA